MLIELSSKVSELWLDIDGAIALSWSSHCSVVEASSPFWLQRKLAATPENLKDLSFWIQIRVLSENS